MAPTRPFRSSRTTRRLLGAACLPAVLLAGCGSAPVATDQEQVTVALRAFLRAQADGDGERACAVLAPAAQRQLIAFVSHRAGSAGVTPTSCLDASALVHLVTPSALAAALRTARIHDVVVRGATATATATGGRAFPPQRVVLAKAAGRWRIARVPTLIGG